MTSYLCAACKNKIADEAYYCKKCGALVDKAQAPDARIPDKSFSSKFNKFLSKNPLTIGFWGIISLLLIYAISSLVINNVNANKDNHSSEVWVMTVQNSDNPLTCFDSLCQLTVTVKNKTNSNHRLVGKPIFITSDGKSHSAADTHSVAGNQILYGNQYCHSKVDVKVAANSSESFISLCGGSFAHNDVVKKVELVDGTGAIVVTANLNAQVIN
jgi:uncharacterized protein affecting Mg2+/Co2+ transport/DNA-directed RNA polymerase subunit RPC12/RpoP